MTGDDQLVKFSGALVVGGGYAGLHAAAALKKAAIPVTVVDAQPHHSFVTRLAAVAGGTSPIGDAFAPFDELGFDSLIGDVERIEDRRVVLSDGRALEAEALVVTAGAVPMQPDLPGIEHSLPLRTAADAVVLRRSIDEAQAVVVIGAGATGIQLAGAISVAHPNVELHVVDQEDRVLSMLGESLGDHAQSLLEHRGVTFHLDSDVERIEASGVVLDSDRSIDGVVVWAGGFEGRADEFGSGEADDDRFDVDRNLRIEGFAHTFAAGDVAAHTDDEGKPLAMAAQIAVQAGRTAGKNTARDLTGEALHPARLSHRGWVLDLGGGKGVAEIGPVPLAAPGVDMLPPLLHLAIDLKTLWGIGGAEATKRFRPGAHDGGSDELMRGAMNSTDAPPATAN